MDKISKKDRAKVIRRRASDGADDTTLPDNPEVRAGVLARGLMQHSIKHRMASYNVTVGEEDDPIMGVYVVVNPKHCAEMHETWLKLQEKWTSEGDSDKRLAPPQGE